MRTLLSPHICCNNDTSAVSLLSAPLRGICFLALIVLKFLLPNPSLCARCTVRPNKPKRHSWSRERFTAGPCKKTGGLCPPNPKLSEGFQLSILKARWGRGVVSGCKLPGAGIPCSCRRPRRSGHDVPVNLQQHTCDSLFYNFLSLYERKGVTPLKVRALRMGCISGYRQRSF